MRAFTLPAHVDPDKVEANYENGVLYLAVPKSQAAQPRQIQIGDKKSGIFTRLLGRDSQEKQETQKKAG